MKRENYKKRFWRTALAAISIGALFGGCKDDFEQVLGICPEVESTNPGKDALGIQLNNEIIVTFNEAMNPVSISPGVFSLKMVNASVSGRIADTAGTQEEISGTLTYNVRVKNVLKTRLYRHCEPFFVGTEGGKGVAVPFYHGFLRTYPL